MHLYPSRHRRWRDLLRTHGTLLMLLAGFWLGMAFIVVFSLVRNDGHLVYALDDAYIHLATARNLAEHGIWGVTRHEFSSSTSSLSWPMLLAAINLVAGAHAFTPLLLNLLFATILIVLLYGVLLRDAIPSIMILAATLVALLFGSVPALVITGMEHLLQMLLTLSFAVLCADEIAAYHSRWSGRTTTLLVLAPLLVATRFESAFVVAAAILLFALRRRWRVAGLLAILAALPVVQYAAFSIANGSLWLPNSVLLKANQPIEVPLLLRLRSFLFRATAGFYWGRHIVVLVFLACVCLLHMRRSQMGWQRGQVLLFLFVLTAAIHIPLTTSFASFFRYHAALMLLGAIAVVRPLIDLYHTLAGRRLRPMLLNGLVLALVVLLVWSPIRWLWRVPQATTNIYQQQVQMGRFVRMFYQGGRIAANDIGAIDWQADIHLLDLWGLGNVDVARAKLSGTYSTRHIQTLADDHRTQIAIVYDGWFDADDPAQIPPAWIRVGRWTIPNNVVAAFPTVSFYAVDPAQTTRLISNLQQFAPLLPAAVSQDGRYIDGLTVRNTE